jgi:hypothetical protein
VVDFVLNPDPKPGEARVKAMVSEEVVLVPLKNYLKYEDGVFYNDEITVDNLKVFNAEGKEVLRTKAAEPIMMKRPFTATPNSV